MFMERIQAENGLCMNSWIELIIDISNPNIEADYPSVIYQGDVVSLRIVSDKILDTEFQNIYLIDLLGEKNILLFNFMDENNLTLELDTTNIPTGIIQLFISLRDDLHNPRIIEKDIRIYPENYFNKSSWIELVLDVSNPNLSIGFPIEIYQEDIISLTINSDKILDTEFQNIYLVDRLGEKHDLLFSFVDEKRLTLELDTRNISPGTAILHVELRDDLYNTRIVETSMKINFRPKDIIYFFDTLRKIYQPIETRFDLERSFKQLNFVISEIKPTVKIKEMIF